MVSMMGHGEVETMATGVRTRLDWVDVAKGISILLVVMMHSAFGVGADTGGTGVLHWIIAFATPFRMPEFFLISGLFLSQVIGRDWLRYADRRVVHYLYFYALWAVIHIVFKEALVARDPALAANSLLLALVQPYGVLWFIYMLAVFSAAAKLLHQLRVPHWLALLAGAVLQIASVNTGSYILDYFAAYFVYFYAGYAFAPMIIGLADAAQARLGLALLGLLGWALLNAGLVFGGGFRLLPDHVEMGFAALPGLHLVLALLGSAALCVSAALLSKLSAMAWLRWLGAHSLVVYLAFALPMGITRTVLMATGAITDTSLISIAVMAAAVIGPLLLLALVKLTGQGRFLFARPDWAHLPGTRQPAGARPAPAE